VNTGYILSKGLTENGLQEFMKTISKPRYLENIKIIINE